VTGPAARRYRVRWLPGTDELLVECHCGAQRQADDPVLAWDWLLAHPTGHAGTASRARSEDSPAAAAAAVP
jgi:hypothetical protein